MSNFEAINIFWNENINDKSNIMDIKYEDLVKNIHQEIDKIIAVLLIHY